MLRFNDLTWRREPYAIGLAKGVIAPDTYTRLVDTFPLTTDGFKRFKERANKWSLSEVNHKPFYKEYVLNCEPWREFYYYVKSSTFIQETVRVLKDHGVGEPLTGKFYSRFEFSALPADGGYLRPHTDIVTKVVTLVIPMIRPGEWDLAWGGGTDVLRPKEGVSPPDDYGADLSSFDKVDTYQFEPNRAVVFYKTDNSWHSVGPIQGPAGKLRRSVTINIERLP